jgi:hypothetical protein
MSRLSKTVFILIIASCLACGQESKSSSPQGPDAKNLNPVTNGQLPTDWRKVQVCGLSFSMPRSLEEKKLQPIDSCIGNYEDRNMRVSLDVITVGIEEKVFTRRNEYASHREFTVRETSIDGFKAEIINCLADGDAKLQFVTVLDMPEPGLTVWIHSKDADKQKLANQIVTSVRINH